MEEFDGCTRSSLERFEMEYWEWRKTKIWADRWIPIPNSFMVASPRSQNFGGELVESFIDREAGGWDTIAVKNVFLPF